MSKLSHVPRDEHQIIDTKIKHLIISRQFIPIAFWITRITVNLLKHKNLMQYYFNNMFQPKRLSSSCTRIKEYVHSYKLCTYSVYITA